uniref:Uncharacterized protein n=1 Tax=Rhizophora mucronata TaxID=61149 RepID=A0A2P2N8U1_RHIMU
MNKVWVRIENFHKVDAFFRLLNKKIT